MSNGLVLLTGKANPELAERIGKHIGVPLADVEVFKFPNDENFAKINYNVRKCDVYVIQSGSRPVNDNLMELLIIVDACHRASANSITTVVPYYPYARSDKKDQPRVPITAKLVADLITVAGADRIITMDLHAEAIQGFFNIPVDHLYAMPVIIEYCRQFDPKDLVIVSPDAGGVARARAYAKRLHTDLAIIDKRRIGNLAKAEVMHVIGDVKDKRCMLIDDIIDTAGSLTQATKILVEKGAKEVRAAATHAVFSDPAIQRLAESPLVDVVVTNTVPIPKDRMLDKFTVLDIAPLLGETIRRVYDGDSVSSLFV